MANCKGCGVELTTENTYGGRATWKCKKCHCVHIEQTRAAKMKRLRVSARKHQGTTTIHVRIDTRTALNARAEANGMTQDQMVQQLLAETDRKPSLFARLFSL